MTNVNAALEKGIFVKTCGERYQCICGSNLTQVSLRRHLSTKKHNRMFSIPHLLEDGAFIQQAHGIYLCICGRRLARSSLACHVNTKIHIRKEPTVQDAVQRRHNEATPEDFTEHNNIEDGRTCWSCRKPCESDSHQRNRRTRNDDVQDRPVHSPKKKGPILPYPIRSAPYGFVYVFNNTFENSQRNFRRDGAQQDSTNIQTTFEAMNYKVFLRENLSARDTMDEVTKITQDPALAGVDALVLFFLSHGERSYRFYAEDRKELDLRAIRRKFLNSACPLLKGKPKLIFTNYCRGKHSQRKVQTDAIESPRDMVTIHAVGRGIMAKRSIVYGTYFVRSLCDVLQQHAASKNLREIYLQLDKRTREIGGTQPEWEDSAFRDFYFMPRH